MWQMILGFGAGVYVGTNYDCKPTMKFISLCIKNNVPKDIVPKKKEEKTEKK
tara:strand:+ start:362 stop:517 length:156 start_codon:yes stop_codon:yes gene_type:complete